MPVSHPLPCDLIRLGAKLGNPPQPHVRQQFIRYARSKVAGLQFRSIGAHFQQFLILEGGHNRLRFYPIFSDNICRFPDHIGLLQFNSKSNIPK